MMAGLSRQPPHAHTLARSLILLPSFFTSSSSSSTSSTPDNIYWTPGAPGGRPSPHLLSPAPTSWASRGLVSPRLQHRPAPLLVFNKSKQMERERERKGKGERESERHPCGMLHSLATGTDLQIFFLLLCSTPQCFTSNHCLSVQHSVGRRRILRLITHWWWPLC